MGFLRRILGGGSKDGERASGTAEPAGPPATPAQLASDEAERDRELLLADARRLDDDLIQRQLRYADRAWTPPTQGGTARAEDSDRN